MKYIISIVLSLCLISCSTEINYETLADKVTDKTAFKLKKEKGLHLFGIGGQMMGDIQLMSMSFQFFQELTLQEARKLLVSTIQEYLSEINSDKELRPYLHSYPFTEKNITIKIFIQNRKENTNALESIDYISSINGILTYYLPDNPHDHSDRILCRESYEEALKKLQEKPLENVNIQISTNQSKEEKSNNSASAIFAPGNDEPRLKGKIVESRYFSPQNIFSCHADDFGRGKYIAQDGFFEGFVGVSFYDPMANFKKVEVLIFPEDWKPKDEKQHLKSSFDTFGIGILKTVDSALGVKILKEEMIGDSILFTIVSIEKMSVLRDSNGNYTSSTRGYLVFQNENKLVLLSNQIVTPYEQKHTPEKHIEKLQQSILDFKKTFELNPLVKS